METRRECHNGGSHQVSLNLAQLDSLFTGDLALLTQPGKVGGNTTGGNENGEC